MKQNMARTEEKVYISEGHVSYHLFQPHVTIPCSANFPKTEFTQYNKYGYFEQN